MNKAALERSTIPQNGWWQIRRDDCISNLPKKLLLERKRVSSIFQEEIDEEQQRINEAERLIKELDEKTKSQEEE